MKVWITRNRYPEGLSNLIYVWLDKPAANRGRGEWESKDDRNEPVQVCARWAKKVGLPIPKTGKLENMILFADIEVVAKNVKHGELS